MNRRDFIKGMSVVAAASAVGVAADDKPEQYDHWNQAFKGKDRRKFFKRRSKTFFTKKCPSKPV